MVAACKELQKKYPQLSILLKLGDKGAAFVSTKGEVTVCPVFKEPSMHIVDTTGAGDCFTAAFAFMYAQGKPVAECLRFASAAAFICITRKGALPSMPKGEEVRSFLKAHAK